MGLISHSGYGYLGRDRRRARWPTAVVCVLFFAMGVIVGGWMFSNTQPRSFIALKQCERCMSPADLAGLLGSVGMMKLGGDLPFVEFETDLNVVIRHPFPYAPVHYVIVPKKDIKDVGTMQDEDMPYFEDAIRISRHLIQTHNLKAYRVFTNGPGLQSVTYLHFHLVSREPRNIGKRLWDKLTRGWWEHSGFGPRDPTKED